MAAFQPRYILDSEISTFDLPSVGQLPNIMNLVDAASSLIDVECGRVDAKGNGSLIYTTYGERILLPETRNLFRVAFTPLVGVDAATQASLSGMNAISGNHFYSGFVPNTISKPDGTLSSLITISGRYSYGRHSGSSVYLNSSFAANILQIAAFFGGPPQFTAIDVVQSDYYDDVGEVWVPAGLYMSSYTEVIVQYNSGFHPLNIPVNIKHACAALVKNFIARAGGITSVTSYSAAKVHVQFSPELVDVNISRYLTPYKKAIAI